MQPTSIPIGTLANWSNVSFHCLPLALGHHCLRRELPPPCLHLFKSCPSFGGWIKSPLPHETCLPLPPLKSGAARLSPLFGYLACATCIVIHPPAQSSGLSRPTVHILQVLTSLRPKGIQNKVMINIPPLSLLHLYLQTGSGWGQRVCKYI